MGNTVSTVDVDTLIAAMEKNNGVLSTEILQKSAMPDLLPNHLTDALVLIMLIMVVIGIVSFYFLIQKVKRLESRHENAAEDLARRFARFRFPEFGFSTPSVGNTAP